MNIDKFDPQMVIDKTNELLLNAQTAVDTFMAIPSEFFVWYAVAPVGVLIVWKLIKVAWNYYAKPPEEEPASVRQKATPAEKKTTTKDKFRAMQLARAQA